MLIKTKNDIPSGEITDQSVFLARRKIIKAAAGTCLAVASGSLFSGFAFAKAKEQAKLYSAVPVGSYSASLESTDAEYVKTYTNYYEFTSGKEGSTKLAQALTVKPWNVRVEGEVEKQGDYNLEDILKNNPLENVSIDFAVLKAGLWWFLG